MHKEELEMADLQEAIAIEGLRSSDKEDRWFLRRLAVGGDITLLDANASPFDIAPSPSIPTHQSKGGE